MSAATAEEVPLERVLERMHEDERLSDMFRSAVEAAMRTGADDKLRLMGRALADGILAEDGAAVDEAEQLLRTAVELDPVDLRALLLFRQRGMDRPWIALRQSLGLSAAVADMVMARLQRLGLVEVERDARVEDPADRESDEVDLQETYSMTEAASAVLAAMTRQHE
jgi:hypothetical protein